MARDYAKRAPAKKSRRSGDKRKSGKRSNPRSSRQDNRSDIGKGNGLRAFFAGMLTGVFACFLIYLSTLDTGTEDAQEPRVASASNDTEKPAPKPRFEFYKRLQEQRIDIDVEPAADVGKPRSSTSNNSLYVLQAGSFRAREDADRRRAELFLLSLNPTIEETTSDNGRWFRVYLGPFETRSEMARARSLTANQDIDTLLLRREAP